MTIRREDLAEGVTLYCGDCRNVLPTLGKVTAMIADPPYGIINKFGVQNKKDGVRTLQFEWDNVSTNDDVIAALTLAGSLADAFFTFCGVSQVSHLEAALLARFIVKPAIWIKSCPPPAMPGNWWPSGFEFALYGYTSGAHFADLNTRRSNVFYTDTYRAGIRAEEKADHPTQKWLPLMERIVRSMVPHGEIALDPFMGSGTTGVAAVSQGRQFIGIEIEPRYFDLACRRISDALARPNLFIASSKPIEKQEALL